MQNLSIEIRLAAIEDLPALQDIARQTFVESYSWYNTPENMRLYLEQNFNLIRLREEMNTTASQFYLMYKEASLIGYMKLNEGVSHLGAKDAHSMEIERIYVLKLFHGAGMGQVLCNRAIVIAKQKKLNIIWLGVWEQNARAIAFYTKNNFQTIGTHPFQFGNDNQTDLVMALTLNVTK